MPLILHWILSAAWLAMTVKFLWQQSPLYLFLIFFVVGAAWLLATVYFTLERLKYKDVRLDVAGPVRPGGKLVATLHAQSGFGGASAVSATLQCMRVYFNDNLAGNRTKLSQGEDLVWSVECRFPVASQPGKNQCQLEFDIPADAEVSRRVWLLPDPNNRAVEEWQKPGFRWQLDVRADVPGIDLVRSFPVEVGARVTSR